jgi:hypothetical protein
MTLLLLACAEPGKSAWDSAEPSGAITVAPGRLEFGPLASGESESQAFTLRNDGVWDAEVTDIAVDAECTSGDDCFSIVSSDALGSYASGDSREVTVTWVASGYADGGDVVVTADRGSPTVALTSEWIGPPIAVCSASPDTALVGDAVTLRGSTSFSDDGHEVSAYAWTLPTKPDGSAATLTCADPECDLAPDAVGTYAAQLVVTDDRGWVSEPCVATVNVVPSPRIRVTLSWAQSGDDMDLHLLAPNGALRTTRDCYYANCVGTGLDWGVRGDATDNPELDLDDIPGIGPENVRIKEPADGAYTVYVNDYPGSSFTDPNDTTIDVYIDGALVWEGTRAIAGENEDVAFATIDFPSGVVTPL